MSSVFASQDASGPPMNYQGYDGSNSQTYPQMSQQQQGISNPPMPMSMSSMHPMPSQQYMPSQQSQLGMPRPMPPSHGQMGNNGPPQHNMAPQNSGPPQNMLPSSNSGSNNQPGPMASPGSIQKLLDENNQYIQLLLDYQSKGRYQECVEYQKLLHRNLVYLATVADSHSQGNQQGGVSSSGSPSNLPPNHNNLGSMNGPGSMDQSSNQ